MHRLPRIAAVATAAALLLLTLSGCAPALSSTTYSGSILDDIVEVALPALPSPMPDLAVGTEQAAEGTPTPGARSGTVPLTEEAASWIRVRAVTARVGDRVVEGDVLLELDDALLKAAEVTARAELKRAQADAGVLGGFIQSVSDGRSDITSKTLDIQKTTSDLTRQRTDLSAQLDAAKRGASVIPTTTPEPTTTPAPTQAELIARLEAAIAKIDEGLKKATEGLEQLTEASAELDRVEQSLGGLSTAAAAVVEGREVVVSLAAARTELGVVLAPVDGLVVAIADPGDVLAAGASAASIRREGPALAETYIPAGLARELLGGSQATVFADSLKDRSLLAYVDHIGERAGYVPTRYASPETHTTRGVRVVVRLGLADVLPAGSPVDIDFGMVGTSDRSEADDG